MKKINFKCKNSYHMHSNNQIKLKVIMLIEYTYVGEALIQIWGEYTKKWVSYEANKCMFK